MAQNIRVGAPSIVESDPTTLKTLYGRQTQSQFIPEFSKVDYRVYNGLVNYDFGFATITSSTSYSTQKQTFRNDATFNLSGALEAAYGAPPNELYSPEKTTAKNSLRNCALRPMAETFWNGLAALLHHEKGLIDQEFITVVPGTMNRIANNDRSGRRVAEVSLNSKYKDYAGFATQRFTWERIRSRSAAVTSQQAIRRTGFRRSLVGAALFTDLKSSDNVFTYAVCTQYKINPLPRFMREWPRAIVRVVPSASTPPPVLPPSFGPDTTTLRACFKGETPDRKGEPGCRHLSHRLEQHSVVTSINNFGLNINGGDATG